MTFKVDGIESNITCVERFLYPEAASLTNIRLLFTGAPVHIPYQVLLDPISVKHPFISSEDLHQPLIGSWVQWSDLDYSTESLKVKCLVDGVHATTKTLIKHKPNGRHARRFYRMLSDALYRGNIGFVVGDESTTVHLNVIPKKPIDEIYLDVKVSRE